MPRNRSQPPPLLTDRPGLENKKGTLVKTRCWRRQLGGLFSAAVQKGVAFRWRETANATLWPVRLSLQKLRNDLKIKNRDSARFHFWLQNHPLIPLDYF